MSHDQAAVLKKAIFISFLFIWGLNEALLALGIESEGQWAEGLLVVAGALASLAILARRLPLQNVVMSGILVAAVSSIITVMAVVTGVPFGPIAYSEVFGAKLFSVLPWPVPFLWIAVVVNGRGVARLILRPWRKTNYYGFWVMGLTCLLAVLLDLSLEPFATARNYWTWHAPGWVWAWYSAPWVNFLGWFVTVLGALAFAIPWLINKQPVKQAMDYQPLILWLLINAWLITGNALHQHWLAVVVAVIGNGIAAVLTIRGARWTVD
jgi:uncharacterized membrane protein